MTSDDPDDDGTVSDHVAPGGVAPDGSTAINPDAEHTVADAFPPPTADQVAAARTVPPEAPSGVESDEAGSASEASRIDVDVPPAVPSGDGNPVLVGVSFDQRIKAQEFLLAMGRLRQDGDLDLQDAVIVDKGDDGKTRVTETIDPSPGRSAMSGAVWTGLLGLFLGGPVGWLAGMGIGAGAGAVTAKVIDLGVPDEWVGWFRDAVRPSSSTVVLLLDDINMPALIAEAGRFAGAELLHSTMQGVSFDDLAAAFETRRS